MGVIRSTESTVYEEALYNQLEHAQYKSVIKTVDDLLTSGNTFRIG
jgi:hypothetical protein